MDGDFFGAGRILGDGRARLHRIGDKPIVGELDLDHMIGGGKGRLCRLLIADLPVVADVAGERLVNRRAFGCAFQRHHRRQFGNFDALLKRASGLLRLVFTAGDDNGKGIADKIQMGVGQRRVFGLPHVGAVL